MSRFFRDKAQPYLDLGWNPIPLGKGTKIPNFKWKPYIEAKVTPDTYFMNWEDTNIGVITGCISNLLVIDADTEAAVELLDKVLPATLQCKTTRGVHYYFTVPDIPVKYGTTQISNKDNIHIDIKANRSLVVVPPSIVGYHQYHWRNNVSVCQISFLQFIDYLYAIEAHILCNTAIPEGERNNTLTSLAGKLVAQKRVPKDISCIIHKVNHYFCVPALPPEEVDQIVNSVSRYITYDSDNTTSNATSQIEGEKKKKKLTIDDIINCITEVTQEKGQTLWLDSFGDIKKINDNVLTDTDVMEIHNDVERKLENFVPAERVYRGIIEIVRSNAKNTLKEYLEKCALQWDGVPRIETAFDVIGGAGEDEYARNVSRYFFLSAVHRVFEPGCFVKSSLVLIGGQNYRKSTLVQKLGGDYFGVITSSLATKDFQQDLQGKWIVELPEMSSFTRVDRDRIKSILSTPIDYYRPVYGRETIKAPRQCVFVCTTNEHDIFDDPTGGTRFLPLEFTVPGVVAYLDAVAEKQTIRDHLWGEALIRLRQGENYWQFIDNAETFKKQAQYAVSDEWEERIVMWYADKESITIAEVANVCLGIELKDIDRKIRLRIADILRKNGWKNKPVWGNSGAVRRWVRE